MSYRFGLLVSLLLVVLVGCGGSRGPSGTLTMKLTFKGAALPEESVVAIEGQGVVAVATRTNAGDFAVQTASGGLRPLPVGEYHLSVAPPAPTELTTEEKEKYMNAGKSVPDVGSAAAKFPVPKKYRSSATSPLLIQVSEGENNPTLSF